MATSPDIRLELTGCQVQLRIVVQNDHAAIRRIRATAEVSAWWGPIDPEPWPAEDDPGSVRWAITADGELIGLIQHAEEADPQYRHVGLDIFLNPALTGRGYGQDAIRTLARHLFDRGHHRLVIDPAADNVRAITAYTAVGFRPVGIMRAYERNADGVGWHDGLLMDLLAGELR